MPEAVADTRRPRLLRHWTVEASCPDCGGQLEHVADGRPSPRETKAAARCTGCRLLWLAEMRLTRGDDVLPHGHSPECVCGSCPGRRKATA